jgi:hypothetical protein
MSPFDVDIKVMEAINSERYSSILPGIVATHTSMDKKWKEQWCYNIAVMTDNGMNEKGVDLTTHFVGAVKCDVKVQAVRLNLLKTVQNALGFPGRVWCRPARNANEVPIPEAWNSQDGLEARME